MRNFILGLLVGIIVVLLTGFVYVRFGFVDPRADIRVGTLEAKIAMLKQRRENRIVSCLVCWTCHGRMFASSDITAPLVVLVVTARLIRAAVSSGDLKRLRRAWQLLAARAELAAMMRGGR